MPTRLLYIPGAVLQTWEGVAVYCFDATDNSLTLIEDWAWSSAPHHYYEVSVVPDQGSWWIVATTASTMEAGWTPDDYGGLIDLAATDQAIWTQEGNEVVQRFKQVYWWIPQDSWRDTPYQPENVDGQIQGHFPDQAPPKQDQPPIFGKNNSSITDEAATGDQPETGSEEDPPVFE
ncbi:hypothetical protein KFU94_66360 [Chloroflexi bacterium TSY]|nr:hypothetical protein [Chloroflexi bacterium TSY]